MVKRRHIAILIALLFSLLAYILISSGLQKFFIVLTVLVVALVTGDDGFNARHLKRKALIDHLMVPALVLGVLPLIYVPWILGLNEFLWAAGVILTGIICWTAGLVCGKMQCRRSPFLEHPVIYSQPNWTDEMQQVLAVEVPEFKRQLPLARHKDLLRDRYRKLAEKSLSMGHRPEDMIKDFLHILPAYMPGDDPQQIADSLVSSPEFESLLKRRDYPCKYTSSMDQRNLRQMYNGTNIKHIVRLLRELYLNRIDAEG